MPIFDEDRQPTSPANALFAELVTADARLRSLQGSGARLARLPVRRLSWISLAALLSWQLVFGTVGVVILTIVLIFLVSLVGRLLHLGISAARAG